MIKLSKILLMFISSFIFFGCYTVAWQPGEAFPTKDNLKQNQSYYYNVKDFGVFSDYYNSAWWTNPDNDFLKDNFRTLMEINDPIDETIKINEIIRDRVHADIPSIILVTPAGKIYNDKSKVRKTAIPLIKTTSRNQTERSSKVRNNNGGRKNKIGKSRWNLDY